MARFLAISRALDSRALHAPQRLLNGCRNSTARISPRGVDIGNLPDLASSVLECGLPVTVLRFHRSAGTARTRVEIGGQRGAAGE